MTQEQKMREYHEEKTGKRPTLTLNYGTSGVKKDKLDDKRHWKWTAKPRKELDDE